MRHISIKTFFLIFAILLVVLSGITAFFFYRGIPIHDINIWRLQKAFSLANIPHPENSVLIEKKIYLGGPSEHGSRQCVYAVGETAAAPLSKKEIIEIYKDDNVALGDEMLPVHVLFSDQRDSPYEMPFIPWQEELASATTADNTPYIIYIATNHSSFADPRCDD